MVREIVRKRKSVPALFTCQGVGMVAAMVTRQSTRPQRLFVACRALHGFVHLLLMPLKADEFVVPVATDRTLVAFTTAFSWGSVLTVAKEREKKK